MRAPTWDVLISTIPHRDAKLRLLLGEFCRQRQPGFGVRILRDNLQRREIESHDKRRELTLSSAADYVCDVDDDDWIEPDYVKSVMKALRQRPDYVGFQVDYSRDGQHQAMCRHSLEYDGYQQGTPWTRDITHLNPLRRELALLGEWRGHTDEEWAATVRETGQVKTQVMIDRVLYHYRASMEDAFRTPRSPWTLPVAPCRLTHG